MLRILFVDDEAAVLEGLRDALGRYRHWHKRFALSGREALRELAAEPADVVVCDLCMPGLSGQRLLEEVSARFPDTIRIVLSGRSHAALTVDTATTAHVILTKPFDLQELEDALALGAARLAIRSYRPPR